MTHTEHVHILFGIVVAALGASAFWAELRPDSRWRFFWPVSSFLLGFFLFIPVERQTRTYQPVGWWLTFLSAFPATAAEWQSYVPDWIAKLGMIHILQHKVTGLVAMAAGVAGWREATGRSMTPVWRWVLPTALIAAGLAVGIHGGSAMHLPHAVEQLHHHITGMLFFVGGITLASVEAGWLDPRWRLAWPTLMFVAGVDLTVLYRLP